MINIPKCIRLVLFCLLVVQGVETNPGSTGANKRGHNAGNSSEPRLQTTRRGRNGAKTSNPPKHCEQTLTPSTPSTTALSQTEPRKSQRHQQPHINDWLSTGTKAMIPIVHDDNESIT
ncbi:hypothetical protein ACF0H5_007050 [Mactra antiquata]